MKYYFYCPNCKSDKIISFSDLPKDKVANCRDGFGVPIYHFECEKCGNLDAGAMMIRGIFDDVDEMLYRHVIEMYQGIRGFKQ